MKIKVNIFRVISSVVLLISGVISYIIFRKNNKYKYMITSALSTLSSFGLLILEIEDNFKPIGEDELEDEI